MVRLVAACIGSVMRLSSFSCKLSLDVRIAAFAGVVVSVLCLKGCLILKCIDEMVIRRCGINCVLLAFYFPLNGRGFKTIRVVSADSEGKITNTGSPLSSSCRSRSLFKHWCEGQRM